MHDTAIRTSKKLQSFISSLIETRFWRSILLVRGNTGWFGEYSKIWTIVVGFKCVDSTGKSYHKSKQGTPVDFAGPKSSDYINKNLKWMCLNECVLIFFYSFELTNQILLLPPMRLVPPISLSYGPLFVGFLELPLLADHQDLSTIFCMTKTTVWASRMTTFTNSRKPVWERRDSFPHEAWRGDLNIRRCQGCGQ